MNQAVGRGLMPPRPNLGPEAWSDAQSTCSRLHRSRRPWADCSSPGCFGSGERRRGLGSRRDHKTLSPHDATPQGRLVACSSSIRETLADRFGTAWRAKTTQELATEDTLVEVLGAEQLDELIRFLDFVDHLKFAPERSANNHESLESELTNWEPRIAAIGNKIETQPERKQKSATAYAQTQNSTPTVSRAEFAGSSPK